MNPIVKAKWIAALRSGEYQQGTGKLRQDSKYCCLGVLCDLHSKETGKQWTIKNRGIGIYDDAVAYLPDSVKNWLGTDSENIHITVPDCGPQSLSKMNDDGRTFEEIADLIERGL